MFSFCTKGILSLDHQQTYLRNHHWWSSKEKHIPRTYSKNMQYTLKFSYISDFPKAIQIMSSIQYSIHQGWFLKDSCPSDLHFAFLNCRENLKCNHWPYNHYPCELTKIIVSGTYDFIWSDDIGHTWSYSKKRIPLFSQWSDLYSHRIPMIFPWKFPPSSPVSRKFRTQFMEVQATTWDSRRTST